MKANLLLISVFIIFISCQKKNEDTPTPSPVSSSIPGVNIYSVKNEEDLKVLLEKAHISLKTGAMYKQGIMYLNEIASDDCTDKNRYGTDALDNFQWVSGPNNFVRWGVAANNVDLFVSIFLKSYEGIETSNAILNNYQSVTLTETSKNRIVGEAYFLRGVFYWHLATMFGTVPVFTTTSLNLNVYTGPGVSVSTVYAQAESDFLQASQLLPESNSATEFNKVNKWAAIAFLGKTYLYQEKWTQAAEQFRKVINSGQFALLADFKSIFAQNNKFNKESIYEISYRNKGDYFNTFYLDGSENSNETNDRDLRMGIQGQDGQRGYSEIIALKDLAYEFEFNDPRLTETLYFVRYDKKPPYDSSLSGYSSDNSIRNGMIYKPSYGEQVSSFSNPIQEFFHIKKAVNGNAGGQGPGFSDNNWRMIRYSDVLLMAAEAIAESNGGPNSEAVGYLNQVRERARKMLPTTKLNDIVTVSGGTYAFNTYMMPSKDILDTYPNNQKILMDYPTSDKNSLVIWSVKSYAILADMGEPITYGYNLNDFRKAIVHERRVELATEYHRFADIKRWDKIANHPGGASLVFADKLFNPLDVKEYNKNIHSLCPIPPSVINKNPKLTQNPGY
ncbi:MAG: RagB/SusD family nutrient uptake outer membrane protein [Bacteroidota bacterium]|nr:RagB/SusD family nutrient uptake outer membrane protein [Bacteroidota bacterium]